jgi:hypothetical protein
MNPASGIMTSEGIGGKTFSMTMSSTSPIYPVADIICMTQLAISAVLLSCIVLSCACDAYGCERGSPSMFCIT